MNQVFEKLGNQTRNQETDSCLYGPPDFFHDQHDGYKSHGKQTIAQIREQNKECIERLGMVPVHEQEAV